VWLGLGVAVVVVLSGTAAVVGPRLLGRHAAGGDSHLQAPAAERGVIPVNVVSPKRQTLVRTFEQPGSVEPWAKAELLAKFPGYLKWIARDLTPPVLARIVAQKVAAAACPPSFAPGGGLEQFVVGSWLALKDAPEKDIGSRVLAGELLLEIDVPELLQDVVQKEALLQQSEAELEQAHRILATFEAAIGSAKAFKQQTETDVKRYESEFTLQGQKLRRLQELARDRTVTLELVDEQRNQVNAAKAAWDSSLAKDQAAQADWAVALSKFAAARAEVLVRESRVRVTREDLHRARILADYAHLRAPFHGVITSIDVDVGDFVQNASTGQARRLLTVIAADRVKIILQVPEQEAVWVRPGTEAVVKLDARAGWETRGKVARVGPALDVTARTRRIEIDLDNKDQRLLPGMYGHVTLILQRIENAPAIPATAVYSRGGETYIIQVKDGVARRQRVRIRYDDGKLLEVVKFVGEKEVSLDGSEELVVSNKGEIADGQRVRATHSDGR
jgi:RND family efflux transporter MFP subunit